MTFKFLKFLYSIFYYSVNKYLVIFNFINTFKGYIEKIKNKYIKRRRVVSKFKISFQNVYMSTILSIIKMN